MIIWQGEFVIYFMIPIRIFVHFENEVICPVTKTEGYLSLALINQQGKLVIPSSSYVFHVLEVKSSRGSLYILYFLECCEY